MSKIRIAVTGATGALGGRVARRLAERGVAQRLIVRDASRAPKLDQAEVTAAAYLDADAMASALRGIDTVFFVSAFESAGRLEQQKAAVDAFVAAGVSRVVYTSFLGAGPEVTFTLAHDHCHTEQYMEAAGLRFAALRNSLYTDLLPEFVTDGVIRGPAGNGKFTPVTRDDIADVAVAVLLDDDHPTACYDVTGPELLTMRDVADILSATSGQPVQFINETKEEAYASRAQFGAPDFEVEGWVTSYLSIQAGDMEVLSDTVERFAGHPPMSVRAFLDANAGDPTDTRRP